MKNIFVDTGTTETAFTVFDTILYLPIMVGKVANSIVLSYLETGEYEQAVFEDITPQGTPIGGETIETIRWLGRYDNTCTKRNKEFTYVPRAAVCKHLTGKARRGKKTDPAMDTQIRQKVIDRLEPNYDRHKNPGILAGVKADIWQALGLAITWSDKYSVEGPNQVRAA